MKNLTDKQEKELGALVQMRDEDIDTSDIPEVRDWSRAVIGKFYRPRKEPVTLRIDVDVLAWLKSEGSGYQTRINTLLRMAMVGRLNSEEGEANEHDVAIPKYANNDFHFPSLERSGDLSKCDHIADRIVEQHSVFACVR